MPQPISVRKRDRKMLEAETIVELLLVAEVLELGLILHLNLDLFDGHH